MRIRKRRFCSSSVIENQYLMKMMPGPHQHPLELRDGAEEFLGVRVGAEAHHALDAARLYQLRSNSTISPAPGRCAT
jgi:hypothetical protein